MNKNKIYKIYKILIPVVLFFATLQFVSAQSLSLTSPKTSYNAGDTFLVALSINTNNKPINTISGAVRAPTDKFQISDVRYGNSIITLWVERPALNASAGTISFAGGIPGGYNGSNGPILSFVVKAKTAGSGSISLDNFSVLLNDGLGTALSNLTLGKLNLTINKAPPPQPKKEEPKAEPIETPKEVYIPPPDTIPPESFTPVVSRHPSIAENSYFVSFSAVDKDSGIARYEAKEKLLILSYFTSRFDIPWTITESPYIAVHQYLTREVLVRAYDQAGNFKEEGVLKPVHPVLIWIFIGFWTLIVAGASYIYSRPKLLKSDFNKKGRARKSVV